MFPTCTKIIQKGAVLLAPISYPEGQLTLEGGFSSLNLHLKLLSFALLVSIRRGDLRWATRAIRQFLAVNLRAVPPSLLRPRLWFPRSNPPTRPSFRRKARPKSNRGFRPYSPNMANGFLTLKKPIFDGWPPKH